MGLTTNRLLQILSITVALLVFAGILFGLVWRSSVNQTSKLEGQNYGQFIAKYPDGKQVYCVSWFTHSSFNEMEVFCVP
jgi:hypothetical protein